MDLAALHQRYLAGASLTELTSELGITPAALYRQFKANNLPRRQSGARKGVPRPVISAETAAQVLDLYHTHKLPRHAIAVQLKISMSAVNRIIQQPEPRLRRQAADRYDPVTNQIRCIDCGTWKPADAFYADRSCTHGKMSVCKECALKRNRKRFYGVSEGDYARMLAQQGGVCAICGSAPDAPSNRKHTVLSVDHAHTAAKTVRGLLCARCNHVLGLVEDSPRILQACAAYLTRAAQL